MTKTKKRIRFYFLYTIIFLVTAWFVSRYFVISGKTWIFRTDGLRQHYKAFVFYSKWLRTIVWNFLKQGKLSAPAFSFGIGFGSDVMTTLHYYAIGDPLNLLSVFVPSAYISYFYEFLIVLRMYLSGIAFSCYCFSKKRFRDDAVLAGSLVYCFCTYAMWGGVRHPFFLTPMICFPLLLLGVDRVAKGERPWLFIGMVAVSGAANFYFFYMLVLLTVLYVFGKYILAKKKKWKESLFLVLRLGGLGFVGLLLAAVILLPVILLFLNSSRQGSDYTFAPLYLESYYRKLLPGFLAYCDMNYCTRMGYAAIALTSVVLLFMAGREKRRLQAAFVTASLMLMIPAAGYILNGMSYVSNRWIWGYSMLIAYIVTDRWEAHIRITGKNLLKLALLVNLYMAACFLADDSVRENMRFVFAAELLILLVLGIFRKEKKRMERRVQAAALLGLIVFSTAGNAYFGISPQEGDYVSQFASRKKAASALLDEQGDAVKTAAAALSDDRDFYRYSSNDLVKNTALLNGVPNTQFYWSLSDNRRFEFWKQMGLPEKNTSDYQGFDSRAALNALGGVAYFVTENKSGMEAYVPYGFVRTETSGEAGKYLVYKNENALPLGFTYTGVITQEEYDKLNSVEKQEALLSGVLLGEIPEGFEQAEISLTGKVLEPEIICESQDVTLQGSSFVVTKSGASVVLEFDGLKDCETYLNVEGLDYRGVSKYKLYNNDRTIDPLDLYTPEGWEKLSESKKEKLKKSDRKWLDDKKAKIIVSSEGVLRTILYGPRQYKWRNNRHNFCPNLGYSKKERKQIRLKFNAIGTYSFDSLNIICQPVDRLEGQVQALREDTLENLNMHEDGRTYVTDLITGDISLDVPKILCLSIPYSDGWTAFVDGKEQKLLLANTMFMALPLESGEHSIRLEYRTPGRRAGIALGILGWLCILGIAAARKRRAA